MCSGKSDETHDNSSSVYNASSAGVLCGAVSKPSLQLVLVAGDAISSLVITRDQNCTIELVPSYPRSLGPMVKTMSLSIVYIYFYLCHTNIYKTSSASNTSKFEAHLGRIPKYRSCINNTYRPSHLLKRFYSDVRIRPWVGARVKYRNSIMLCHSKTCGESLVTDVPVLTEAQKFIFATQQFFTTIAIQDVKW